MGQKHSKKPISIIDQQKNPNTFLDVMLDQKINCTFYSDFDSFIEKQSLKKIEHLIIRTKDESNAQLTFQQQSTFLIQQEQESLIRQHSGSRKPKNAKDKLLAYIKKYGEERLSIYIYIEDLTNYRLPDHEFPYITLVADKVAAIRDSILSDAQVNQGDGGKINIKLKRMIRDLYRKILVKVILPYYSTNKNEEQHPIIKEFNKAFKENSVTAQIYKSHGDFQQTIVSTFCEYLICLKEDLLEVIEFKKANELQYKIIVFGDPFDIELSRLSSVWAVDSDVHSVVQKMKRCSNITSAGQKVKSQNAILFGESDIFVNNMELIRQKIEEKMDRAQYQALHFELTNNYETLLEFCNRSVYSVVISFQSNEKMEKLRKFIRQRGYHIRLHLVGLEKDQVPKKKLIDEKIEYLMKKIDYIIKFEISPVESLTVFKGEEQVLRFFRNKMGLKVDNIEDYETFERQYLPPNYNKVIQNFHFVCTVQDYIRIFKGIFQGKQYEETYLSKIKIIIVDQKEKIKKALLQNLLSKRVVQAHYNMNHIKTYLEYAEAQKLSMPFFAKHALSRFFEAGTEIKRINFSNYLCIMCSLTSRNELFKQVFQANVQINKQYKVNFLRFSAQDTSSETLVSRYEDKFMTSYANLWKINYSIIKPDNLHILKDDIKNLFFKCKNYDLLKVSDEEFEYFYIKKIDECNSFLDIQITCIYIYSLPHGLSELISDLFRRPRKSCLAIKLFCHFIVTLLSAFCSFDDQTMCLQSLVLYIKDDDLLKHVKTLKPQDILYNISFMHCFRDQDPQENQRNHSIIFELQNLPFLSRSRIKQFLQVQRFSFYKESTEFLVAPFTKFMVKSVELLKTHYQIRIVAIESYSSNDFIHKVFQSNNLTEQDLAAELHREIVQLRQNNDHLADMLKKQNSLYKKAEVLGLNEQKRQMIESINRGLIYQKFSKFNLDGKYFSAQKALYEKCNKHKSSSKKTSNILQIQQTHMVQMLQVQRAMLAFNSSQYTNSIRSLYKVEGYLSSMKADDQENWGIRRIQQIRHLVQQYHHHRSIIMEKAQAWKKTKIKPSIEGSQIVFKPKGSAQQWQISYDEPSEKFFMVNLKQPAHKIITAKPVRGFGQDFISSYEDPLYEHLETEVKTRVKNSDLKKKQDQQLKFNRNFLAEKLLTGQESPIRVSKNKKQSFLQSIVSFSKQESKEDCFDLGGLFDNITKKDKTELGSIKEISVAPGSPKSGKTLLQKNFSDFHKYKTNKEDKTNRNRSGTAQQVFPKQLFIRRQQSVDPQMEHGKEQTSKGFIDLASETHQKVILEQQPPRNDIKKMQWQVFVYQGKFKLVKKGKHFKMPMKQDKTGLLNALTKLTTPGHSQMSWMTESPIKSKLEGQKFLIGENGGQ